MNKNILVTIALFLYTFLSYGQLVTPTGTTTNATCSSATDGSITITNVTTPNALTFNGLTGGNGNYVDLGGTLLSNRAKFTIEGWIQFKYADLVGKTRISLFGQNDVIEFGFINATTIECYTVGGGSIQAPIPTGLSETKWHHIAAVGSGSNLKLYYDGILLNTVASTTSNYGSNSFTAKIGGGVIDAAGQSFPGSIMKVGFYNTELSATTITSLASCPITYTGSEAGIIAGYNFFNGSGTTLTKLPSGTNGTLNNTPIWINPYNYAWTGPSGFTASTKNISSLLPGSYTVTVSTGGTCTSTKTFVVGSNDLVPVTTGPSICIGGSGSLTSSTVCGTFSNTQTFSGSGGTSNSTSYPGGSISVNVPALPAGAIINSISTIVTYTSNIPSWRSELLIRATPPLAFGIAQSDLQPSTINSSGTVTEQSFGTWGTASPVGTWLFEFKETFDDGSVNPDANISNISIIVNYTAPHTLDWYTAASGGTKIGSGSSFNPVGVAGSGLPDTNTAGTTPYYAACSSNPGCRSLTNFVINPKPTTPTFTKTDIDCINATGTITVTVQNAGETYSFDNGATFQASNSKSGLGVGSYNVVIKSAAGCNSPASAAIVIADKSSTTWTTTGWSNGSPSSTSKIIFNGDYTFGANLPASDLAGCSCEVLSGIITVPDGFTLTLTNELTVTGGTLTFENNASLVQTSTTATNNNTREIYYKRHTTPVRRYDFTYWSSPVQPQTMFALSPNSLSDKYYSFDSDINDFVISYGGGATMQPANGYLIRAPQTFDIVTPAIDTAPTFFGVPNNGNYSFSSTATAANNKSYLLGNPYPSALDAVTFLGANSGVLDGTLYFWTHNSNVTPNGAFYEYSDNDYATFNLTGGTGVASTNPGVSTSPPSGKIAAGQGFFATGIATGPINFTNAMRVGVGSITGNNSQFFRTTKTKAKTTTAIEKNRVWLNLYNTKGAFKQALIGYVTGATNAYDSGYDGESFDGNEFVDFYSVTPENYLVIQGRALPFDETDTVPLGYRSKEEMNLNISIDQTDGVLATQNIYIEDKLLNVIHNIKDTPYAFTTEAGTFDDRFVLRYTDKTLGTGDFNPLSNQIIISKDKNELKIKSELETIKRVTVFDLLGRKVFEKDTEDSNEFRSSGVSLSKQIGVVKVTLTNGKVISKKVRF